MRVLAFTHSLGSNGAAVCLCRVLIAIKAAGGTADVVCRGNEPLAATLRDHGVGVIEQAHTSRYDVALVNTLIDHARVPEVASTLPVVLWVHEGTYGRDNYLGFAQGWVKAFRLCSRVVFVSRWQSETVYRSFIDGVEPHRLLHVNPGMSTPAVAGYERRYDTPGCRIVSLGSVYPRKRPADLVKAVMRMDDPGVHCTFVGNLAWLQLNGPEMLEAIERNPHLFTLAGEVPEGQHKTRYLHDAHVFCSASGDEAFSLVAQEAAAMGLPLALSDLPCYQGVWRHGENALMAPVGAIDCLSWNLKALTQDRQLAARLGRAAMQTAARYTQERFLRGMSDALLAAIQDPIPRPMM